MVEASNHGIWSWAWAQHCVCCGAGHYERAFISRVAGSAADGSVRMVGFGLESGLGGLGVCVCVLVTYITKNIGSSKYRARADLLMAHGFRGGCCVTDICW